MPNTPTDEQAKVQHDFLDDGLSVAVQAGAGTGKTTTIAMVAHATPMRGVYTAFNKSIVEESGAKMPMHVDSRTTHSLAYRAVGHRYKGRLSAPRMRSDKIARLMGMDPFNVTVGDKTKVLQPGYLASLAMRAIANFSNSDHPRPTSRHIPYIEGIDAMTESGRGWDNNNRVMEYVADFLPAVWADMANPNGELPFRHDQYVKLWELGRPVIRADYLMLDEAQDTAPVMASIIAKQGAMQKLLVGDSAQSIYEWRGAVDAFAYLGADTTDYLTQSFRFGTAIADVANLVLAQIPSPMRLRGLASIPSTVEHFDPMDGERTDTGPANAVLCRTNGKAMSAVLTAQRDGRNPYLMGGGEAVLSFARAAAKLMSDERCFHTDLSCFDSWDEVIAYVANDPQGSELAQMVKLVEDFGVQTIMDALGKMPRNESGCDLVVSTAHKAKGREWPRVQLASDFTAPSDGSPVSPADYRLLYVAATRAQMVLDPFGAEVIDGLLLADQEGKVTA
jgi:hypothetical protein